MSRVLVIGDLHSPATHPGYLHFCEDLAGKYKCNSTILIGDVIDWHAVSRFNKHPEADSVTREYELARKQVSKWHKVFPRAKVTIGNHDSRIARQAAEVSIPEQFIKGFNEMWGTMGWEWLPETMVDNVYYFHGTGTGGQHPAYNTMQKMLLSTVQGHIHTAGGIKWRANPERRIFAMDTGCGVDDKHIALTYAVNLKVRSILSAGVVIDGVPSHHIMQAGDGERYHRSRFKK